MASHVPRPGERPLGSVASGRQVLWTPAKSIWSDVSFGVVVAGSLVGETALGSSVPGAKCRLSALGRGSCRRLSECGSRVRAVVRVTCPNRTATAHDADLHCGSTSSHVENALTAPALPRRPQPRSEPPRRRARPHACHHPPPPLPTGRGRRGWAFCRHDGMQDVKYDIRKRR